jgi:hypothetical protein
MAVIPTVIALGNTGTFTRPTVIILVGFSEGHGYSLRKTVILTRSTVTGLLMVLMAVKLTVIASGNIVNFTRPNEIGLLGGCDGNKTHGDSLRE